MPYSFPKGVCKLRLRAVPAGRDKGRKQGAARVCGTYGARRVMGGWFAPEIRTFSRGKGDAPATAKAAYRSGSCITDHCTGVTYDYTYRRDIDHSALFPPTADSPDWTRDRAALWNEDERRENRKNSVTARELMTPLPA